MIFALNQTLLQQESLRAGSLQVPYTTEDLIRHYNCGDLNSIIFNRDTSQVTLYFLDQGSCFFVHDEVIHSFCGVGIGGGSDSGSLLGYDRQATFPLANRLRVILTLSPHGVLQ